MTPEQRQAAIDYAVNVHGSDEVVLDVQMGEQDGFDEVPDGAWLRAWVWVPQEAIPGYTMTPPAPASTVTIETKT